MYFGIGTPKLKNNILISQWLHGFSKTKNEILSPWNQRNKPEPVTRHFWLLGPAAVSAKKRNATPTINIETPKIPKQIRATVYTKLI